MSNLFRKRPVTIEARQLDGDTANDHSIYLWIEDCMGSFDPLSEEIPTSGVSIDPSDGSLMIATLEGVMHARRDDWIIHARRDDWVIHALNGAFYPCRDNVFRTIYESVGDGAA